jgi:hypothetical protein
MPSSFFSSDSSCPSSGTAPAPLAPAAPWRVYGQHQQQPNQGSAGTTAPPAADLDSLDEDDDEASSLDGGSTGDDTLDLSLSQDPGASGSGDNDDPPAATTSTADPLRAERRRSNQLEKELRKARAQLSRFSEINPDEYARLQDAESKREEFERQVADRERQLNEAILRRVRSVEKERDVTHSQVQNLRKEPLLERLFREAEDRVGGDERGTFFDTFVTLCGGHLQLGEVDGRERLLPVDGKGQPLTADGVALSDQGHHPQGCCTTALISQAGRERWPGTGIWCISATDPPPRWCQPPTPARPAPVPSASRSGAMG